MVATAGDLARFWSALFGGEVFRSPDTLEILLTTPLGSGARRMGLTVHEFESWTLYEKSGYTRLVTWYDAADYQVRRVDYYDRKDDLLKTLTLADYQQYLGRFWRAHDLFMENHQTGKKTRLRYESYEFQTGLTDGDFNKSNLKRAR